MTKGNMLIMSWALERRQIRSWECNWNRPTMISVTKKKTIFFRLYSRMKDFCFIWGFDKPNWVWVNLFLGLYTGCSAVNTVLPGLDCLLKVHNERGREQLSGRPAPPLLVLFTADFLPEPVPACQSSESNHPFQNKCHSSCKQKLFEITWAAAYSIWNLITSRLFFLFIVSHD